MYLAVNEHTIKGLKARLASLKEIHVQIKCADDMKRILRWAVACVTVHNMLINFGDLWLHDNENSHYTMESAATVMAIVMTTRSLFKKSEITRGSSWTPVRWNSIAS